MKTSNILFIAAVLLSTNALAQEKPKPPSRNDMLKAVETFARSPLSPQGKAAAATIAKFAEESDDVTIIVAPKVVPWFESAKPPKFSDTLLAAYLAGNIKSQLERRTNANDSYAGILQVLRTYAQLKETEKALDIPEVQTLVDLEAKKQLKKYLDDAQQDEDSDEEAFKTAVTLLQQGQHKEAIPYLKRVLKQTPDNPNVLWNLGIALAEVGESQAAAEIWHSYHKVSPDDWQAMAKLIQCYQALGDFKARDSEIKSLREYRESSSDPKVKSATRFCREQCVIAGQKIFAFDYFSPEGPRALYLRFSVVDAEGKEQYCLSLGSYDDTISIARNLGEIKDHERLYHLDEYRKGQHKTYKFFKQMPDYDQVRTIVTSILEGKLKPVSSSFARPTNEK